MTPTVNNKHSTAQRRRYLVHLLYLPDEENCPLYVARIRPWHVRNPTIADIGQRIFADDCELIETVSPLLPPGSDVRDVFGQIESPSGFFYLLHLSIEQAMKLGWRE